MVTGLDERIYRSYEEIDRLQQEIQREGNKTTFEEKAFRRAKLAAQYSAISENSKVVSLLSDFIDNNVTSNEIFAIPIVPGYFMQIIMMSAIDGDEDTALKYVTRFKELASKSTVKPDEQVTAGIMKVVLEVQMTILMNNKEKYEECLGKIKEIESLYNRNIPFYNVDMDISIHEFYGMCYSRMNALEDAIRIYGEVADMAEKAGRGFRSCEAYKMLSNLYEETEDMENALKYYKLYNKSRDNAFQAKAYAYSQYLMDVYSMEGEGK